MTTIEILHRDLLELRRELEAIKMVLANEGKLTPWAKKALAEARAEDKDKYISLEDL